MWTDLHITNGWICRLHWSVISKAYPDVLWGAHLFAIEWSLYWYSMRWFSMRGAQWWSEWSVTRRVLHVKFHAELTKCQDKCDCCGRPWVSTTTVNLGMCNAWCYMYALVGHGTWTNILYGSHDVCDAVVDSVWHHGRTKQMACFIMRIYWQTLRTNSQSRIPTWLNKRHVIARFHCKNCFAAGWIQVWCD